MARNEYVVSVHILNMSINVFVLWLFQIIFRGADAPTAQEHNVLLLVSVPRSIYNYVLSLVFGALTLQQIAD